MAKIKTDTIYCGEYHGDMWREDFFDLLPDQIENLAEICNHTVDELNDWINEINRQPRVTQH